jgi:hypothetical protein
MLVAKPRWMLSNKPPETQHMSMRRIPCYPLLPSFVLVMQMLCTVWA